MASRLGKVVHRLIARIAVQEIAGGTLRADVVPPHYRSPHPRKNAVRAREADRPASPLRQ